MLAAERGFGRWGFILGNVLMAFGAPVLVTSLVTAVANHRAGTPVREEDVIAVAAGTIFMIAGLVLLVTAGRGRPVQPAPRPVFPATDGIRIPVRAGDSFGGSRGTSDFSSVIGSLDVSLSPLDDYYERPGGGLALDGEPDGSARGRASVPPAQRRNSRGFGTVDRYCEPTITGTRSNGSRRRPPAG